MAGSLDSNGRDIENSFVLNLRLKRAVQCRLCVSCGTSAIEIEERCRKNEKRKRDRERERERERNREEWQRGEGGTGQRE